VRRRLTLALAAFLAGACTHQDTSQCLGTPVGTFTFTLHDPGGNPPDCRATPPAGSDVVGSFVGTLSVDPGLGTAALCTDRSGASPYRGQVVEGVYGLTAPGGLAVLAACGQNCATSSSLAVAGSIVKTPDPADPAVVVTRFEGTLTESFTFSGGDCGTCALPCAATYTLTGVP
jgi:hypothetical protein